MSAKAALVEVTDLDLSYRQGEGWLRILHGVSFAIHHGEAFGLVGESGCGKSTIAYQLLGYWRGNCRVEGGRIGFKGTDLLGLNRSALDRLRGNRVSLVPQDPTTALDPSMRVGLQVLEVLKFHDVRRGEEKGRVAELFRLVGLPDPGSIGRLFPHQLSGGQQQRVCIAMALSCEPDLVVLDEPTTGLDVTTQEQIVELLADLRTQLGMSMLYVTHDLGVLAQIADRVGVMYAGRMVEIAPTAMLFTEPKHPYTRGLIASVPRIEVCNEPIGPALRGLLKRDQLPPGCPFQPRCDFAEAACAVEVQHLDEVADGHRVACRRWRSTVQKGAVAPVCTIALADEQSLATPMLSLEGVSLGYGSAQRLLGLLGSRAPTVVQDLSLAIAEGETFALVGESGSGKSTVARSISGLLEPRTGRMLFRGEPLPVSVGKRSGEARRRIQYIFQNPDASLNPRARIGTILARPIEQFFGVDRQTIGAGVARALEAVQLDASYADRYPDELSGGERQRVAIARALIAEPALLICDEILSALDVSVQANVLALLRRLRQQYRLSMLFISHDLAVVRSLADQVGVLFRGQLMEIGGVEDVFAPPFHPYTHELLMAVPSVRSARRRTTRSVTGKPPAANRGCVFAGRCPWQVGQVCEDQPPPWRQSGVNHRVRCHIPADELVSRAEWRKDRGSPCIASSQAQPLRSTVGNR